jgi:glycosyltransferase involved in cell wall biosynthesis
MAQLYDQADIYLNSPNIDNMPNSVIEAFAAGLPVVTTNAGGIPYIVTHEVSGLLADVNDHKMLASHSMALLKEPEFASRIASMAHAQLEDKYTWTAVRHLWRLAYGFD